MKKLFILPVALVMLAACGGSEEVEISLDVDTTDSSTVEDQVEAPEATDELAPELEEAVDMVEMLNEL